MEKSERQLLYIQSCFEVVGKTIPLDGAKVDIIRAMGLLSIYSAQGVIPDYKTWEASTFGNNEEEDEIIPYSIGAEIAWAKVLSPEMVG